MPMASAKSLANQLRGATKIDELYSPSAEVISVFAFERRAGKYDGFIRSIPLQDGFSQRRQPRRTIGIVERNSVANFLDVRDRVEIIRIGKFPTELLREQPPHRSLTRSDDAHDDENQMQLSGKKGCHVI